MDRLYDRAEIYDLMEDDARYMWNLGHWQKLFQNKGIQTMLDVSIGSGAMTLPVLDMGITLSGSDLSESMLKRCREKAEKKVVISARCNVISERSAPVSMRHLIAWPAAAILLRMFRTVMLYRHCTKWIGW